MPDVPAGVVFDLAFHTNSEDVAFSLFSARSPLDAYSFNIRSGRIDRWTKSETGGLNTGNFREPQIISWKSFDSRMITGFLYTPDAVKFPGRRPVIVSIHGGPEEQSRPVYMAATITLLMNSEWPSSHPMCAAQPATASSSPPRQRFPSRRHLQGHWCAPRLDRHPAWPRCQPYHDLRS